MPSLPGSLTTHWGDTEHIFRLGVGEWREVQKACDAGPGVVAQRLFLVASFLEQGLSLRDVVGNGAMGEWRIDDMRSVILNGLIGGGMGPIEAAERVRAMVDTRLDFRANLALAYGIVMASFEGLDGTPPGELKGAPGPAPSPTDGSTTSPSTATRRRSAASTRASPTG